MPLPPLLRWALASGVAALATLAVGIAGADPQLSLILGFGFALLAAFSLAGHGALGWLERAGLSPRTPGGPDITAAATTITPAQSSHTGRAVSVAPSRAPTSHAPP